MTVLVIDEKCREMMMYGYNAVQQFPKHEKHVLGAEIRLSMLTVQRLIITAYKRYHKKTTLTDLDIELSILRRRVRLAKDLRGEVDLIDIQQNIQSWLGHARHASTQRLTQKLLSIKLKRDQNGTDIHF